MSKNYQNVTLFNHEKQYIFSISVVIFYKYFPWLCSIKPVLRFFHSIGQANVQGIRCNECKRSFFDLQAEDPLGCKPCYCSGVTVECKCAKFYRDKVSHQSLCVCVCSCMSVSVSVAVAVCACLSVCVYMSVIYLGHKPYYCSGVTVHNKSARFYRV